MIVFARALLSEIKNELLAEIEKIRTEIGIYEESAHKGNSQMHNDDDIIRIMREMAIFEAQCKIHHREKQRRDYYLKHIYNRTQRKRIQRMYNNTRHK